MLNPKVIKLWSILRKLFLLMLLYMICKSYFSLDEFDTRTLELKERYNELKAKHNALTEVVKHFHETKGE